MIGSRSSDVGGRRNGSVARQVDGGPGWCYWIEDALDAESESSRDADRLRGAHECDVCVIGGGFTGLWTALRLKELRPDLAVTVLEASLCGTGASGRNGGLAMDYWHQIDPLVARVGVERARWLADAARTAIDELESFCREHDIDAHFRRNGWIWAATSKAQMNLWQASVDACARLGERPFRELSREEVVELTGSSTFLGGVLDASYALVQPARLARGLRRVALASGVEVFEHSPVLGLDRETGTARTPDGNVRASAFVVATNAWAARIPELRRLVSVTATDMVVTEPMPEVLSDLRITQAPFITDARMTLRGMGTTADGRVVFGQVATALAYGGRVTSRFDGDPAIGPVNRQELSRYLPFSHGKAVTHAWAGPVDHSWDGLPYFGRLPGKAKILYGIGFTGNGVGPCRLAGRILASMALGLDDEWSNTGLERGAVKKFPPEPIRYLGGSIIRRAVTKTEDLQEEGREPGVLTRAVTALTPEAFYFSSSGTGD